jgi:hypothetical protein
MSIFACDKSEGVASAVLHFYDDPVVIKPGNFDCGGLVLAPPRNRRLTRGSMR